MQELHYRNLLLACKATPLLPVKAPDLSACGGKKKAVYKVPSAVTNGHDNAVRQGLASPFLCLTSLDGVYAPTLKRAQQALCANSDPVRQKTCPPWGRWWKHARWPLIQNISTFPLRMFKSTEQEFENLIYNNWI